MAGAALSACSSGATTTAANSQPSAAKPAQQPRKAFDPPVRFGNVSGADTSLEDASQPSTASGDAVRPAVSLSGGVAYVAGEDGLKAVDTGASSVKWSVNTTYQAERGGFGTRRAAPLVVAGQGGTTVFAAYDRTIPGQGTMPARAAIEVLAVDAASGKAAWHAEFMPTPSSRIEGSGLAADENVAPKVIAADTASVVITADETTYVVDRTTRALRWQHKDFSAVSVTDGVVAGGEAAGQAGMGGQLGGLALDSGQRRWTAANSGGKAHASPAGPGLVAGNDHENLVLVDARTGTERARYAGGGQQHLHPWRCLGDEQSLVLCQDQYAGQTNTVVAFDTTTAAKLWSLPDTSGRVVPQVTAFWHGAVYGQTQNGPVVLDGRTGKDREAKPGAAPFEVDQYGGLAGDSHTPLAVPASA
ncbi:hypothetical protein [Streptomyces sp. NPDC051993]|uniref:hypothetical protein n=1 Tax=Streptomyces sp. NPDC051993 TaxID=3155286 RepID=UPI0034271D03